MSLKDGILAVAKLLDKNVEGGFAGYNERQKLAEKDGSVLNFSAGGGWQRSFQEHGFVKGLLNGPDKLSSRERTAFIMQGGEISNFSNYDEQFDAMPKAEPLGFFAKIKVVSSLVTKVFKEDKTFRQAAMEAGSEAGMDTEALQKRLDLGLGKQAISIDVKEQIEANNSTIIQNFRDTCGSHVHDACAMEQPSASLAVDTSHLAQKQVEQINAAHL